MTTPRSPKVVCISGSLRFEKDLKRAAQAETLAGRAVLPIVPLDDLEHALSADDKARLDEAHLRKVELCDELLVVDVGGYVGASTKREIDHALKLGKGVRYWSRCPECGGKLCETEYRSRDRKRPSHPSGLACINSKCPEYDAGEWS